MNILEILIGISGGVVYGLVKLLKSLFDNGYVWWAVAIIVAIIIYYLYKWIDESESTPTKTTSNNDNNSKPVPATEATDYSKNVNEEIIAEVDRAAGSQSQILGCLDCGQTLRNGRYRILNYISHGGFGNTYFAEDLLLDKYIAIKELFLRDICSRQIQTGEVQISIETNRIAFDNLKRKFIKEAKRLKSFNSPNIIKVYDCFEENGTAYYTMDYISGNSLASIVKEKGKLKESTLRKLLPGLLDALKLVHSERIWHLDIKPANLMLRNDTSIVLIDFGASKQFEDKEGKTLTSSSAIYYTTGYAPPEQISNNVKNIGAWTDIYALGATLYNLLTGEKPPQIDEIVSEGLPPFPSDVSDGMIRAIITMMQPNRNVRPQTISEVIQLLRLS